VTFMTGNLGTFMDIWSALAELMRYIGRFECFLHSIHLFGGQFHSMQLHPERL
jgi:hypothetical protein